MFASVIQVPGESFCTSCAYCAEQRKKSWFKMHGSLTKERKAEPARRSTNREKEGCPDGEGERQFNKF